MENKKCNHKLFWQFYKIINFNKTFSSEKWVDFLCDKCHKKCNLKWEWYDVIKNNSIKKYLTYFLWLLPAIILIFLVAFWVMWSKTAILIVIAYHFWAMCYVFKSNKLKITKKWFFGL